MAGQLKKSTKKYEKKHLKGELERRRAVKKSKQRHQQAEKKKARRAQENGADAPSQDAPAAMKKGGAASLKDMSMDDFFQGGFDFDQSVAAPGSKKRKRNPAESAERANRAKAGPGNDEMNEDPSDSEGSSVAGHKQDLAALAEKDPGFYKYLQENDAELLDFDAPALVPDGDDENDENDESEPEATSKPTQSRKGDEFARPSEGVHVTVAMCKQWKAALEKEQSLAALKEVILAFRAAANSDSDEDLELKYVVPSAEVFHEVLVVALQHLPPVLLHHFPVKERASGQARVKLDSKKLRNLPALLSMHVGSVLQLLGTITDAATVTATLAALEPVVAYVVLLLKKPLKQLLTALVGLWSDAQAAETVRIHAFLLIRRVARLAEPAVREPLLKTVYQGLVRGSRRTTAHTLAAINVMKNSAVELWGLDAELGYATGFRYIRQLALHLRTSITQPSAEAHRAIFNWQYVHALDFWSRVLATHCSPAANPALRRAADSPLHPLIYPLVQIALGVLRQQSGAPAYFPLRFHLVQLLLRLADATATYIPLAPPLLDILAAPELRRAPRAASLRPLDFAAALHAPKAYLRTRVYQDGVGEQVVYWLAEFFGAWAKNIAFPELVIPPTFFLKRWLKEVAPGGKGAGRGGGAAKARGNANGKLNAAVKLLLQKLAANAAFVETHRATVDYAVSNRAAVDAFLRDVAWADTPLGAYVRGLRQHRAERDKLLEASRLEDNLRRDEARTGRDEGGDDGVEEEDEVENDNHEGMDGEDGMEMDGTNGFDDDDEDDAELLDDDDGLTDSDDSDMDDA